MKRGFLISVGAYLGLWLVLEALFPAPSYAYLDPGTGNVLVYLAISLVGTVLYFVKNIVYAIMGRAKGERRPEKQLHHERILMFSEGRSYYYTFKPVIDAFLRRGVPFSYITMDVEDPALTIENDLMNSRYIGTGSAAFARAAGRRADIMLSTTPNIGTPGFPMPRPRRVTNLAHICHGVGDIAMYQKGSLDHYDAVLMVGDFMLPSIRKVEELRGLPPKECVSLGLPYLDELAAKARKKEGRSTPPVVLVAPSWGNKGCLNICGPNFLLDLAKAGYDVILRPHPQSLKVETEMLDTIHEMLRDYPNVSFDTEMDATASMSRADVMISDKSCVRFDSFTRSPSSPWTSPCATPNSTRWRTWASSGKTPWPPVWAKWSRPRTSTTSCPWWNAPSRRLPPPSPPSARNPWPAGAGAVKPSPSGPWTPWPAWTPNTRPKLPPPKRNSTALAGYAFKETPCRFCMKYSSCPSRSSTGPSISAASSSPTTTA